MLMVDACFGRKVPRPPVWMMRQAGRYLPEYRAIRAGKTFLEMCRDPELVRTVTLQPIDRFDMDAAIIFSDILVPLVPMGLELRFAQGEGPVIDNPIRTAEDLAALRDFDPAKDLDFLGEALRITRAALAPEKALIGFGGAPFTLACYAVQGCGGSQFPDLRRWMFQHPDLFDVLMTHLTDMTIAYFKYQVACGAQVLQLFDTWGGLLSPYDYLKAVFPHVNRIMRETESLGVPRIFFVKCGGQFRKFLAMTEADVIGLDWTMPLIQSREYLGDQIALQGNLDPMVLFADPDFIRERTLAMLENNQKHPGYIANLGHGIHKDTPPEHAAVFVETVKSYRY